MVCHVFYSRFVDRRRRAIASNDTVKLDEYRRAGEGAEWNLNGYCAIAADFIRGDGPIYNVGCYIPGNNQGEVRLCIFVATFR